MVTRFGCAVAAGLMLCGVAAAETLEEVEKKILAEAEKAKTWTSKMAMDMDMEGSGMKMKSKSEGSYEYARRGEKMYFRMELKSTTTTKMGDEPENKTEVKALTIADGEFMYALTDQNGQKSAMKMKFDLSQVSAANKAMFEYLRKDYELKLLPDEKVDGKEVYVIEAKPKKPKPDTTERHMYYYTKEGGVAVKSVMESKSAENKTKTVFTMSDIKLNADIKPERFVFKAPDGVEVQDMTKEPATHPDEAKPADEKPSDDAKEEAKGEKKAEKKSDPPPKEEKKPKLPKLPKLGR